MKYVCDVCKTQYNTAGAAKQCEFGHEKEKILLANRASAEAKISEAINAFVSKYKDAPHLELTDENQEILISAMMWRALNMADETFDMILKHFGEGNNARDKK